MLRAKTRAKHFAWVLVAVAMLATAPSLTSADPPLQGQLAFVRLTDGFWQVWERDLASGRERQRTSTPFDKRYPEWDRTGRLYFRSNNDELFRLDAGAPVEVAFAPETWPALDPVPAPATGDVAIVQIRKEITDASAVFVLSTAGGESATSEKQRLTPGPGLRLQPDWNRKGNELAFVHSSGANLSEIRIASVDGRRQRSVIVDEAKHLHPAFSPDGRELAYSSNRSGDFEIWLHRFDSSKAEKRVQLTRSFGMDTKPTWSRDGKRLAFASYRSGRFEIWVMDSDGTKQQRLIASADEARDPAWR